MLAGVEKQIMGKKARIRAIALCVLRNRDRILVNQGFDPHQQESFYRPLGGGIDFGETSQDAAVREIKEELDIDICEPKLLGVFENIFVYDGQPGHEIVFIYDAKLVDESLYEQPSLLALEGERQFEAKWVALADIAAGKVPLYPTGLLDILQVNPSP